MNDEGIKVNCNRVINNLQLGISRRTMNNWMERKDFKYWKHSHEMVLIRITKLKELKLQVDGSKRMLFGKIVFFLMRRFSV